jgi:hypothetical protein
MMIVVVVVVVVVGNALYQVEEVSSYSSVLKICITKWC